MWQFFEFWANVYTLSEIVQQVHLCTGQKPGVTLMLMCACRLAQVLHPLSSPLLLLPELWSLRLSNSADCVVHVILCAIFIIWLLKFWTAWAVDCVVLSLFFIKKKFIYIYILLKYSWFTMLCFLIFLIFKFIYIFYWSILVCFLILIYFFLFWVRRGSHDLSSLTRDWTWAMAVKAPNPNH